MKFNIKIFMTFLSIIVIVSLAFTGTFLQQQKRILLDDLHAEGISLASLSAYNARLGVLSENEDHLRDTLNGVMKNRDVIACDIFSLDERLLARAGEELPLADNDYKSMEQLLENANPVTGEHPKYLEFWFPVLVSQPASEEEILFSLEEEARPERIVGFLRLNLGTQSLQATYRDIVIRGAMVALLLIFAGALAAYYFARLLSAPLMKLKEGAQIIGAGRLGTTVDIDTKDEVGQLAESFNEMSSLLAEREKEKARLTEQLEQSKRLESIGKLSAGISHDFNNILSIIQHNLDIAKGKASEYVQEYLDRSLQAADRGSSLVSRLMDFSSGQSSHKMSVNMAQLTGDTVKLFDTSAQNYHISLDVQPGLWTVQGEENQIHRIIMNLLTNAQEAIAADAGDMGNKELYFISIGLENVVMANGPESEGGTPKEYVRLTVRDNGCGMDADTREHIFVPFFSTRLPHGSGLGLSTVYGIVTNYGGRIDVESDPGQGSTFMVFLPRSTEVPTAVGKEVERKTELVGGKETILLVDDEPHILHAMKEVLDGLGYATVTARNGREALDTLTVNPEGIDLLLMDHLMPEMTGLEVIQQMRKQDMDHKVIIYSGFKLDQHEPNFPGVRFLKKPFGTTELSQQIRDVLGPEHAVAYQTHMNRVRVHMQKSPSPPHMGIISDADTAYRLCRSMADEPREVFVGLFLDSENKLIAFEKLSTGTTNESRIYPREVVRYAVATNATAVVLVHNHPSGNLEPSPQDLAMTIDVIRACSIVGIEMHEHLVISQDSYISIIGDGYLDRTEDHNDEEEESYEYEDED